jgi:hypothetical protein
MNDELNQVVEQQAPEQEQEVQKNSDWEASKQESLRALRERAEASEKRERELERMLQANLAQQQQNKMQLVEEDDFDISDDTYIEGKHLKKYIKNLKQDNKKTKEQLEQYIQKSNETYAIMQLKNQFNDFESVVNKDTLEKLAQEKPSLYRTILANQDIYDRGHSAYELIKHSGILNNQYAAIDKRVEDNKSKPRSSSNASPQSGETPLSRVGEYDRRILTDAQRDAVLKQSLEWSRNG